MRVRDQAEAQVTIPLVVSRPFLARLAATLSTYALVPWTVTDVIGEGLRLIFEREEEGNVVRDNELGPPAPRPKPQANITFRAPVWVRERLDQIAKRRSEQTGHTWTRTDLICEGIGLVAQREGVSLDE